MAITNCFSLVAFGNRRLGLITDASHSQTRFLACSRSDRWIRVPLAGTILTFLGGSALSSSLEESVISRSWLICIAFDRFPTYGLTWLCSRLLSRSFVCPTVLEACTGFQIPDMYVSMNPSVWIPQIHYNRGSDTVHGVWLRVSECQFCCIGFTFF